MFEQPKIEKKKIERFNLIYINAKIKNFLWLTSKITL